MRELLLTKQPLNHSEFVKRSALESDYDQLIEDDVIAIDSETKQIIFIHKKLDFDDHDILWALGRIKYEENTRTNGLKTRSRIFGYNPRNTVRKDFCSTTSLAYKQPREHAIVCQYGVQISGLYSEFTPETYAKHKEIMQEKVLDEWAIKETPFTSGIINKNNPLKYHFDSGNFKNVYSCMAVFKKHIRGGFLSMPEYRVGVSLPHNSVFMFDGQSVLHGVTPITKTSPDAVRYSIVYYSLQQIWNCLPLSEEIARIRNRKTERERRRARGEVHETFNRNT
jgi:hypothetical protein